MGWEEVKLAADGQSSLWRGDARSARHTGVGGGPLMPLGGDDEWDTVVLPQHRKSCDVPQSCRTRTVGYSCGRARPRDDQWDIVLGLSM